MKKTLITTLCLFGICQFGFVEVNAQTIKTTNMDNIEILKEKKKSTKSWKEKIKIDQEILTLLGTTEQKNELPKLVRIQNEIDALQAKDELSEAEERKLESLIKSLNQ